MKLSLFEQMVELNRSFDEVAASLQGLERVQFFQRHIIRHALSDVEVARVYGNRESFDNFEKILEDDARWAYKFQRAFNEKFKDRDDICLELKSSEERRKRKGLPARIVILPDWDLSDEDIYDEAQAKRRRQTLSKRRYVEQKTKGGRQ